MLNEANSGGTDPIVAARDRIQTGPIPSWVNECSFDSDFKSGTEAAITFLLFDTQLHAERREAFIHQAIRLEKMEAVQHWSQWRLQFEPKSQLITMHLLKIRRGDVEINQLNIEKAHLLQREEGLERFVIHGWFTFLMILEDVRPGDILEFSYTIESQPRLFPELGSYFFSLPQAVSTGKYHFVVRFNTTRQRQWKSSATNLKPVETQENEVTFWEWSGEKYIGLMPEPNTPSWHISYPWIQVSDFPDWQTIAIGISKIWTTEDDDETVSEIASEIERKEPDLPSRIESAIRMVQDKCRYLSVNLELGGHIPTSPAVVARRRFGDCKDLSFLLVNLLKKLGAQARPVLVNPFLRNSVGDLLPSPSLFNHVVVEFQVDGKARWIDTTLKNQGGGPFNRVIPDYGLGLPVDPGATNLVEQPKVPGQSHLFDLHENFLLATSGEPSLLAVTLKAEGNQAEMLRQQLTKAGLEEMGKQRLQVMVNRFGSGKRIGSLQYRDDRVANQFMLAEVFEVSPFLSAHPNNKLCRFPFPSQWVAAVLPMPEKTARRTPYALPHPCHITYVVDIDSFAIQKTRLNDPRSQLSNQFLGFSRDDKAGHGYVLTNFSLTTNAAFVPANQVQKYGELVEQVRKASSRELSLLKGYSRSRPKRGFGELPMPSRKVAPAKPTTVSVPTNTGMEQTTPRSSTGRHHHRHGNRDRIPNWLMIVGAIFVMFWLFIICLILAKRHP
jgi:hypothetical protein